MIQTVANASTWRSLACVALVATLLPLSTAAQTFNDPRQRARDRAAARPPLTPPGVPLASGTLPTPLHGAWTARVHCGGHDHVLRMDLAPDGQVSLTAEIAGDAPRGRLPAWPADGWTTAYDPGADRLLLRHASDPRAPAIDAVVAADGWAGLVRGRGWEACSTVVGLRPDAAGQLRRSLPAAAGGRRERANPLERLVGRLSRRDRCDRDALAWVGQYLTRVETLGPRPSPSGLRSAVTAMYADAVFAKAFGETLADLNPTEAQNLLQVVQSSTGCNLPEAQRALAARSLHALTLPLADAPQHSRRHVAIDLAAQPLFQAWATALRQRVDAWQGTAPGDIDPARLDGAAAAVAAFGDAAALPAGGDALRAQLDGLRHQVAGARASQALLAQAAEVAPELEALQRLVRQLAPRAGTGTPDAAARDAVAQRVDALLPAATESWATRAQGVDGWRALQAWPQAHGDVVALAGSDARAAAQAAVDSRRAALEAQLVAGWQQAFARDVAALPPGAEALAAGTAFETRLRAEAAPLAALPPVQALTAERAQRRVQDLAAATPALVAQAAQAPHVSALQALRTRHLLPGEEGTPAAQALAQAIAARQAQIAPLADLPAADYLNALYGGDVERLQALDRAFREPYKAMMLPMLQHTAPLVNAIAGLGGIKLDYGAMAVKALDNVSLIAPMFAVYLIEFEGRLGPCLGPDAVRFKITRTSETVYKDGWGNYKYSVRHPDQIEYFTVPRRFGQVFEQVGLSKPDSLLGGLLDRGFRNAGRVGITELVSGTRAMMQRFDREGCGSPLMQHMEARMLDYFARYREGNREVLDAAFGGGRR